MNNVGPSKKPNPGFSVTKPAGTIAREDLIIGTHPWLFNKDHMRGLYIPFNHTRYGGLTVIPEHLLAIEDKDKARALIDEYVAIMNAKPLTDEEKRQRDEWDKLILNLLFSGPLEYLDDDFADDMIAWSEGRGKFPSVPRGSTVENWRGRQ
ncbi:hypothetical protein L208DRAFT_1370267 [Tricholoma matsutake]|nr:hypothetical protein L208DRAFT_1370267 [Tricholoma matsutake 945]